MDDRVQSAIFCSTCETNGIQPTPLLHIAVHMERMPYLLAFLFESSRFIIDKHLVYKRDNFEIKYDLCGVVYGGHEHFFSRIINGDGWVWFHDGRDTGSVCIKEKNIAKVLDLSWLNDKDTKDVCEPLVAIYARA
jgi:hypothetical protein